MVGGYRFLMRFYCPGDEIYIFGFSRGAYIARFLAEMLDYVGLLSHGNEEMVHFAWKAFSGWQRRQDSDGSDAKTEAEKHKMYEFMKGFRETFSRPVRRIRFLGLFDTVNSVPHFEAAWMQRSKFPYTARTSAKVIRHAVGIDERRAKFRQDLVYQSGTPTGPDGREHGHHAIQALHNMHEKYRHRHKAQPEERGRGAARLAVPGSGSSPTRYRVHSRSRSRTTRGVSVETKSNISDVAPPSDCEEDAESESDNEDQDIDEVWFAGGHGDIGGGWEVEEGTRSASHVPLMWMVREASRAGLRFDPEKLEAMGCLDGQQVTSAGPVPGIQISASTPTEDDSPGVGASITGDGGQEKGEKQPGNADFHEMLHKACRARIHDSLEFACGLSKTTVLSWKMMEYLPFRRMDLQSDGSWKPIRWPLPAGEVRDVPDNVRIHGSVIRRMQMDETYRPGNLIIGGGGRGCRVAPKEYGTGEWECVAEEGDPVGEIWVKKSKANNGNQPN